jgi:uncharacterized protein (TIGR00369 family)
VTQNEGPPVSPFIELVGASVDEAREGYARMSLTLELKHTNPNSVMHGGVVTTLLDETLAIAVAATRGLDAVRSQPHTAIEMNTSFLSSAREGDELVVEGRLLKKGRTVFFGEAEARRKRDDALVAKGRVTFVVPRGLGEQSAK